MQVPGSNQRAPLNAKLHDGFTPKCTIVPVCIRGRGVGHHEGGKLLLARGVSNFLLFCRTFFGQIFVRGVPGGEIQPRPRTKCLEMFEENAEIIVGEGKFLAPFNHAHTTCNKGNFLIIFFRYGIEGWRFLPKTGAARSKRTLVIPPPHQTRRARRRPVLGGMVVKKGDGLTEDCSEFEVEKGR